MKQNDLLNKWLDHSISEEEMEELKQTEDFPGLARIADHARQFRAPAFDQEAQFKAVKDRIHQLSDQKSATPVLSLYTIWRVAAVVVIALIAYYAFFQQHNTVITTDLAEQTTVFLPDGSEVVLNAASTLSYDADGWESDRSLELNGEAYFKVEKGSTFTVQTKHGDVTVLGTQFDVNARSDLFSVHCFEGLVAVATKEQSLQLAAGNGYNDVLTDNQPGLLTSLTQEQPSWMTDYSSFANLPFSMVIEEFERQYKVEVETINVDLDTLFSGSFPHNNLSLALKALSLPLNLQYTIVEDKITLSGE
ncbi:FecR family protein [Croceiramulus getboli]|nr:FecR family protein [Flavobacteriaceae bacterium YJPT1-3]